MSPTSRNVIEGVSREKLVPPWWHFGDPPPWFLSHLSQVQQRQIFERQLDRQEMLLRFDLETIKAFKDTLKKTIK